MDFQPPEFDEVKFMQSEMRTARATIIVVLWTVPAAVLSYGVTVGGAAIVAFFAGIGMMFLLKWIFPFLKVDISQYKRKDWIGHGTTFFFSWLAFWILLLNPPFADLTAPTFLAVTVNGAGVPCNVGAPYSVGTASSAVVNATVGDNVAVTLVTIKYGASTFNMSHVGGILWTRTLPGPANATPVVLAAYDAAGHGVACSFDLLR